MTRLIRAVEMMPSTSFGISLLLAHVCSCVYRFGSRPLMSMLGTLRSMDISESLLRLPSIDLDLTFRMYDTFLS
ncbi:uncharacterized protein BDV17DRAFT_275456 [Aspergillus undulatus]|uniref:uncharacterized protein n=1 Tax=Aspergillus undulatus TaxID=1810928 RepID=UPI003CCC987D